jgi:hypothetical protein
MFNYQMLLRSRLDNINPFFVHCPRERPVKTEKKTFSSGGEGFFTVLLPIIAGLVSNLLLSPSQS